MTSVQAHEPPRSDSSLSPSGDARAAGAGRVSIPALIVIACASMLVAAAVQARGFVVQAVGLHVANDVYQLDADIDFALSEATIEALENGVALTVVVETDVLRTRQYMWNETIADIEARYSIEYHALSDQYVSRNLELGLSRSYRRLEPLLADLGRLRNFPLLGVRRLAKEHNYRVRVRARLDIESLQAPMRPLAYLSSLWRLDSDWYEWPITR